MTETVCVSCGVRFAIDTTFRDVLVRTGQHFFCPNGHEQWFANKGKSEEVQRLERELAQAVRKNEMLEAELEDARQASGRKR